MPRPYHKLVPYAFKRFSIVSARSTALPTLLYSLRKPCFQESEKPALVTMNILPPLMSLWWHFAKRALGTRVDIFIFDCSGKLNPDDFPGARVQKFLNFYAATKCNEFLYHIAKNRKIGWMCDDDIFLLKSDAVEHIVREFRDPKTASVSFRPRTWWHYDIAGKNYPVSSSYCTAINRDIFCNREHLSLAPKGGNTHPTTGDRPPKSYDTFDKANEILLTKGYLCTVLPENIQNECITGFHGVSNGVMLLNYFKNPEQMLDFLLSPPKKQWEGSVLYNVFGALLAIDVVQDLAEKITGKRSPLPSLPAKADLVKIRREHEPLLRGEMSWKWIDEAEITLRKMI
ncbi:MAG TPA: hypothetical protein VJB82_04310 [Candidatus Peribacterales bacterium]|nr:hypothetical protein [Candidatus Peribacterales bacterium]